MKTQVGEIEDYILLDAEKSAILAVNIKECIKAGYVPHGTMVIDPGSKTDFPWYYQAMLRFKK